MNFALSYFFTGWLNKLSFQLFCSFVVDSWWWNGSQQIEQYLWPNGWEEHHPMALIPPGKHSWPSDCIWIPKVRIVKNELRGSATQQELRGWGWGSQWNEQRNWGVKPPNPHVNSNSDDPEYVLKKFMTGADLKINGNPLVIINDKFHFLTPAFWIDFWSWWLDLKYILFNLLHDMVLWSRWLGLWFLMTGSVVCNDWFCSSWWLDLEPNFFRIE